MAAAFSKGFPVLGFDRPSASEVVARVPRVVHVDPPSSDDELGRPGEPPSAPISPTVMPASAEDAAWSSSVTLICSNISC